MNRWLWCAAVAFIATGLFPPWKEQANIPYHLHFERSIGYSLLWSPPGSSVANDYPGMTSISVDGQRLLIEWFLIGLAATLGAFARRPTTPEHAAPPPMSYQLPAGAGEVLQKAAAAATARIDELVPVSGLEPIGEPTKSEQKSEGRHFLEISPEVRQQEQARWDAHLGKIRQDREAASRPDQPRTGLISKKSEDTFDGLSPEDRRKFLLGELPQMLKSGAVRSSPNGLFELIDSVGSHDDEPGQPVG